ncbi:hypothetical protein B0H14DRAFT_2810849, partial [Mycena olivaceomarginata]
MEKSSVAVKLSPLQPSIPNGAEQNIFTLSMLLPSLSAILTDVTRIESTRVAWIHVDENEIYEMQRGNVALLVFNGDALTNFLIGKILESVVGTDTAGRLAQGIQSLAALDNNDLSAFIFEILPGFEHKIRTLTVTKIHEQLDKHRKFWKEGMPVMPRNYRLKNKAAKLHALRIASAQLLDVMGLDELGLEKSDVGMGRLIAAPRRT